MLRILFVGLMAVAAVSGYLWYSVPAPQSRAASAPPAVAVTATPATARDIPVLLSGIGTVQALNTVQIRSRLDGTLDKVNFEEGQQVKQGEIIAIIDPRLYQAALDQAKAKLAQDQAQLLSDEKDLERSRQLSQQRFASQQSVDQLTAKVGVDRALIEADQAFIRTAETNLSYTTITAPFSGRVGLRAVDPGNIVKANDTSAFIATLTQQHPIGLVFTLPEAQLAAIREAQRAGEVPVIAMDQEGKKPIAKGKLQVIDNQVDQTTGMIRLKAVFDNQDDALWPGPIHARAGASRRQEGMPSRCRLRRCKGGRTASSCGSPRLKCERRWRRWKPGRLMKVLRSLEKGLKEGDLVIVSNQYRLQPNARIELNTPPVAANEASGRIMNISAPFITRPIATTLLMAAFTLCWHRGLLLSAGRAAAAGRLPHHPGFGAASGRKRRDHGVVGRQSSRAAVRADRRGDAAHVHQHARQYADQHPVRAEQEHRRGGAGRAGGDHGGGRRLPTHAQLAAELSEIQPGRSADRHTLGHLGHRSADRGRRLRGEHPRAADLADPGRRLCAHRRPAEALRSRADRPGEAGHPRPHARRCARPFSGPSPPTPPRAR